MLNRRIILLTTALAGAGLALPAVAAAPAESFIAENIQRGFDILNDKGLGEAARRQKFADFLLGLTDMHRIALFMLGKYAATATPADIDAFVATFQDYTLAVYQSYFAQYAGQSLRVTGSHLRAADDTIVTTMLQNGSGPTEVDFRVRSDSGKPVLVDFSVAGLWLGVAQRDEFETVLARNNGDIKALIAHLRDAQSAYH